MSDTALELLQRFARENSQDAFSALVNRHLNLVHSAALRQVRSPQLAEEVAQSAFTDLARNAGRLKPDTLLTAWLYQVTRRTAIDVVRREARRQLREHIATEMNALNAPAADWSHIAPLLDEAMSALDDTDRAAVLLRYFENKSLREVGAALGTSDDAAQKRVSRAVEHLRDFFAQRGVTVGAGGLVVILSANAVQAAPVGLAVAISTTAALAGTTIAATATATTIKTITMTTLQKTLVTATVAVLVGAGIYEARQAAQLRDQVQSLQQQQAPLAEKIQKLNDERENTSNQIVSLNEELAAAKKSNAELLKLRGEITMLRNQAKKSARIQISPQHPQAGNAEPSTPSTQNQTTDYPKANWSFAGYVTPEAALQSWTWAYSKGDQKIMLECLSPQERPKYESEFAKTTQSQFAAECEKASSMFQGYQIVNRHIRSDSEIDIAVVITTTDGQTTPEQKYKMIKGGNDWKMAGPSEEQ